MLHDAAGLTSREAGAALAKRHGIAVRCFWLMAGPLASRRAGLSAISASVAQVCVRRDATRSAPSLRERIRFGDELGRHRIDGGVDVLAADHGGLAQLGDGRVVRHAACHMHAGPVIRSASAGLSGGAARGIRTPDPLITNEVLYQLSYCGPGSEEP